MWGDRDAHHHTGLSDLRGTGVVRSPPDAVLGFETAAEAGHTEAQFHLAALCQTGDAYTPGEGARWFEVARAVDAAALAISLPRQPAGLARQDESPS